jgi:hypothetical protein
LRKLRQRTATEFSDVADALIHEMEQLGYAVSAHGMGDYVEMHAVELKKPNAQQIARVADGDEEEHSYRSARELAWMAGIELEDG